jgi:hypothetical protein
MARRKASVLLANPVLWVCAGACVLGGPGKAAAESKLTASLERHWTNNALDSDRNVDDWYTLLRGSLEQKWGDADTNAGIAAEFQATRYDRTSMEDGRALALSAQAFHRFSPALELRGSLSYRVSSEGDDLDLGVLDIGMRTTKQTVGGQLDMGIDLGHSTVLALSVADSFEMVGDTRFQDDLLTPAQLDPNTNRFQFGAKIVRTVGEFAFGASASALLTSVQQLGSPPVGLSFNQYGLQLEAAYKRKDGTSLALAFGGEYLDGAFGIYSKLHPSWQITFARPLGHGLELRGTYFGRYESADTDDPLASWLHRGEIEAIFKARRNLVLSSGTFCEVKKNLLLENEERSHGFYAEAAYDLSPRATLVFRLDLSRTFKTVIDVREHTVDAFVGLRAKI